ncbi:LysR family transcriptional regulator [Solidesulfovibrio sp.]|uniref:LysR family transcriptional regulator n=1 Tax=Solidesulfovibrio sp. TaxID=2910990 RepID=UPI00262C739C|nr:LysR family transcriptional regulator [Solidesulfovibrio sp.]
MELRDLKTFVTVASLLNFNQAGKTLHAAQSTVSVRVQALEVELGVRLFDRLGRRVVLTEAGERLLEYGRKLLDLEEEARAWVSGEGLVRGALTVRIPESLCTWRLPGVLCRFRRRCPDVRLRIIPCAFDGLTEDLRRGVTDLAFVLAADMPHRDMRADFLGSEPLVVVAAPGCPLAGLPTVGPAALEGMPLVFASSDCSYRRLFESLLTEAGCQPSVVLECGSVEAVRRYVMAGLGVTIVPEIAVRAEASAGRLVVLPWEEPLETGVLMVWHKDKWLSPALAGFMETCRDGLMEAD